MNFAFNYLLWIVDTKYCKKYNNLSLYVLIAIKNYRFEKKGTNRYKECNNETQSYQIKSTFLDTIIPLLHLSFSLLGKMSSSKD